MNNNQKPSIACHKCVNVHLEDASQDNTSWKCDFCRVNHRKGDFRLRCRKHDFDVCLDCTQRFSNFDQSYEQWKHACQTCKYPLVNATYSKNTRWSCDQCKVKYEPYSQLRLRCEQNDYDLCGNCCKNMQTQFNQPGAVIYQNTQFGHQQFNSPPQQQQGFNAPQNQFQQQQIPKNPSITCHRCVNVYLEDASQDNTSWKCDFCKVNHRKGDFRLRCRKHDFDVCENCTQRFSDFDQSYQQWKHACKTCQTSLSNSTYSKNTRWSCDQCKQKYEPYTQLRLRCEKHDYDLCGNCCKSMQTQNDQLGGVVYQNTQNGQQGFNIPPQQQQAFNVPPQNPLQTYPEQNKKPTISCHRCVNVHLEDASQDNTSWKCDFCKVNHRKGDFRLRCRKHDFDVCFNCTQRFSDFDQSFESQKHACKDCKHPLSNATYSKNTKWSCDQCKQKYEQYSQLRLRCDKHDYDLCGNCCKTMQHQFNQPGAIVQLNTQFGQFTISSTSNQPQQQQGFNVPNQQQQGFNAPPQQQQGFNAPPQQQQGFNAPPQQQQGFNAPPQQQQQQVIEQVFIGGTLHQEQVIRSGQFMSSPSNQYHLLMQHDGNLVLYSDKSFQPQYIVWSTNTANKGQAPHLLKLQGDGNLVIYDRTNTTTWASNTYNVGAMPYKLCIQEDRNICLYDRNNQVTFQTNTTLQQQGFNAPPSQQYQQQGFNASTQQFGIKVPPQQKGFNQPPISFQ